MNVFNRIVVILLLLLLLLLSLVAAWNPFLLLGTVQTLSGAVQDQLSQMYYANPFLFRLGQLVLGVVFVLLWGSLLLLEVRRGKPATVEVTTGEGQKARVLVDSVALRLAYHLDQLADVINVTPRVKGKGNTVHVAVEVETTPDVDIPMKTEEIVSVIREVVEERMGLHLGRVDVHIKHAPYPGETEGIRVIGAP